MKYYLLAIESEVQDFKMENEIKEIVYQYFISHNISGECTLVDYTFLSFYCRQDNGVLKQIRQEHIIYIEKNDHKVILYTHVGVFDFYSTLKQLEEKLDPTRFVRVHQGYIVNINEIKALYTNELSLISSDKIIPVSRRNRGKLNEKFSMS